MVTDFRGKKAHYIDNHLITKEGAGKWREELPVKYSVCPHDFFVYFCPFLLVLPIFCFGVV